MSMAGVRPGNSRSSTSGHFHLEVTSCPLPISVVILLFFRE